MLTKLKPFSTDVQGVISMYRRVKIQNSKLEIWIQTPEQCPHLQAVLDERFEVAVAHSPQSGQEARALWPNRPTWHWQQSRPVAVDAPVVSRVANRALDGQIRHSAQKQAHTAGSWVPSGVSAAR